MILRTSKQNEQEIARAILKALAKAGYEFAISYERGYDEDEMLWTRDPEFAAERLGAWDEEHIMVRTEPVVGYDTRGDAWVYLIYGNGDEGLHVVSDYTMNLKDVMGPINDLTEAAWNAS